MSEKNSNHVKEIEHHLRNVLMLAGEITQKVGGKILENSKQFSQFTTTTDSQGIQKTQPSHPVG